MTPTNPPGGAAPAATGKAVAGLQRMLAASHAAVYVAAATGGALAPLGAAAAGARALAQTSWVAHQQLRDELIAAIEALGAAATPARAAYRLPYPPTGADAALRLLAQTEDAAAATAHDATAALNGENRRIAVDALSMAAIRAQRVRLAAGLPPATATRALPGTL